jgi:hypothetical protein
MRRDKFKLGAVFSLPRDRETDSRHCPLRDSSLALAQMRSQRGCSKFGSSTRRHRHTSAGSRQAGLEERVRDGHPASVYLNENQRYLLKRRDRVTRAERALANAADGLALYLSDADGRSQPPPAARQPGRWPDLGRVDMTAMEAPFAVTLAARPKIGIVAADLERDRNRLALGENASQTRLDPNLETSRDLGAGSFTARVPTPSRVSISRCRWSSALAAAAAPRHARTGAARNSIANC